MRTVTSAILASICAVTLVGCGGSGGTIIGTDHNPRIRLVDAFSTPATANLLVDNQVLKTGATYESATDYNIFENGNHQIKFLDGTTAAELQNSTQLLELNQFYTAIAYRNSSNTWSLRLLSDKPDISTADGQLRIPNTANNPVDIYVTDVDADITAASPTIASEDPGATAHDYVVVPLSGAAAKNVEIRVTAVGSKVPIATTTLELNAHEAKTVVVTQSGATVDLYKLPTVTY